MSGDRKVPRSPAAWLLAAVFTAWTAMVMYFYLAQLSDELSAALRRILPW